MIFLINTTSDISKLLYVISQAVRRVKFRQFWSITSSIFPKYHVQIMLLFVYTTTRKRFVIFTCRYFKLSWNATALSVIVWESVPVAKRCGQPIWLKLGTEVGYNDIFQKPLWPTSLNFSFGVTGGVSFLALWAQKIQPSRGHFESLIRPHW